VRGIGAMWGIELVQDRATKAPFAPGGPFRDSRGRAVDAARWACDELFDTHAVHIGAATNVLLLAPPLIFSDQDVDELVTGLSAALTRVDAQCS
ncbi:MAG: aspartate aminotransferase family protein, partial [Solirubrobacteraceae bacterium]